MIYLFTAILGFVIGYGIEELRSRFIDRDL